MPAMRSRRRLLRRAATARWRLHCNRRSIASGASHEPEITSAALLQLAGCGESQPIVKLVPAMSPEIPDCLLTCPASPEVPGQDATQADVGKYLLALYSPGAECR